MIISLMSVDLDYFYIISVHTGHGKTMLSSGKILFPHIVTLFHLLSFPV